MLAGSAVALVAAAYALIAIREANTMQVIATGGLVLVVPILFFVFESLAITFVTADQNIRHWLNHAWRLWWQLLAISVVPVLIVWGLSLLIDFAWSELYQKMTLSMDEHMAPAPGGAPIPGPGILLLEQATVTLRLLFFGFVVPLAMIQLWIATARHGMKSAARGAGSAMCTAFAPRTLLTYFIGLIVIAVIPYLLLFTEMHVHDVWWDMILLGARMAVSGVLLFGGWVVMVGAMTALDKE